MLLLSLLVLLLLLSLLLLLLLHLLLHHQYLIVKVKAAFCCWLSSVASAFAHVAVVDVVAIVVT